MRRFLLRLALATLALVAPAVHATTTTVCVTTAAQLDARLKDWASTNADLYTIEVQQGTYDLSAYDISYSGYGSGASLRLLGGYYAYNANPCGKRVVDATNTVLHGDSANTNAVLLIDGFGPELTVEGMTFRSFGRSIELETRGYATTLSEIIVTDIHDAYPALWLSPGSGTSITLQNALIYGNPAKGGVWVRNSGWAVLINNTITQNGGAGIAVGTSSDPADALVAGYNNILWGNSDVGLKTVYANNLPNFVDTLVDTTSGSFTTEGVFTHADPKFVAPSANPPDFSLQSNSPAINVGAPEWETGGYTSADVIGNPRIVGSAVDLGAYESAIDDVAPQLVTKTADDNSAGTLRTAINTANGNVDATTIRFAISGACPQVITLAAPLPDITTDVTIDAYTQPGSLKNGETSDFDPAICLIVRGSVDHAMRVTGSGRLTVKGIEFEGFSNAAVWLSAGSNSQVVGNAFSVFPGATANVDGVLIDGTAKNSVVGWTDPPEHNVFGQSTNAAIEVNGNGVAGGHYLFGNYIGFAFGGTALGNANGIELVGSGGNRIESNVIGNSANFGMFLTGPNTTANAINLNSIGLAPFTGAAAGNGSAGVAFANGAHDNRVGPAAGASAGAQNEIRNNVGPGIWLTGASPYGAAGSNNRITGDNRIHDNDGFLSIDLGAGTDTFGLGPTVNDPQDADAGPNRVENYPYLTQAMRFEADKIALDGYLIPEYQASSQTYRLDVFWTDACTYAGHGTDTPRGEMKRYVGYLFVSVPVNSFLEAFPYTTITAPRSIPGTGFLFATATDNAGNTSEPGPCETFVDDYIFTNGFN